MSAVAEKGFELSSESTPLRPLLRDLWRSRGLIRILARKDFYVRFRRASFGLLWAVGLPLVQASVLALVLSRIAPFKTALDLPVFVFAGVLPWATFSAAVVSGATSIVQGQGVATRIYFPRAVLPLVSVMASLYGFVPGLVILIVMAAAFGTSLGPELLLLIPASLLLAALAAAFALLTSAMQVYFRDVQHIIVAAMLPWFWASGVFFPLERLGGLARWLQINPAVGMLKMFRASLGVGGDWVRPAWITVGWIVSLLVLAAMLHRRYDRVFVDLL